MLGRKAKKSRKLQPWGEEMGEKEEDGQTWATPQCRGDFVGGYERRWLGYGGSGGKKKKETPTKPKKS